MTLSPRPLINFIVPWFFSRIYILNQWYLSKSSVFNISLPETIAFRLNIKHNFQGGNPFKLIKSYWISRHLQSRWWVLAHLSRRLTRWAYRMAMLRRPSSVHNFKDLLLWNRLPNQSQTSCGASWGKGNKSLYKWSRSHDQDGRHGYK